MRNKDVIVDAVMKSFEAHTPKPYLKPMSCFFPEVNSAQLLEIRVGAWCDWVSCSPCGDYIAAGGGQDVVVADVNTGDVLKRLHGHSSLVTCVKFVGGSKKIVSASRDGTVAVWEWGEVGGTESGSGGTQWLGQCCCRKPGWGTNSFRVKRWDVESLEWKDRIRRCKV